MNCENGRGRIKVGIESESLMATQIDLQYVSNAEGQPVAVIVPIDVWHEIESSRETAYLLKSDAMKRRLLEAKERTEGTSLEDAREKLGI